MCYASYIIVCMHDVKVMATAVSRATLLHGQARHLSMHNLDSMAEKECYTVTTWIRLHIPWKYDTQQKQEQKQEQEQQQERAK